MIINKKKILITLIALVVIILVIKVANNINPPPKIENYLRDIGFNNEGESALYYKQISDIDNDEFQKRMNSERNAIYEILYFNVNKNELTKNKKSYEDGIFETFIPTYDYSNQELNYTYKIIYNNTNIIFEGKYNLKNTKFTCENIYSYKFELEAGVDAICNKIKYDVEDFKKEAQSLITNKELLKKLKA